jgi:hypothetical protein
MVHIKNQKEIQECALGIKLYLFEVFAQLKRAIPNTRLSRPKKKLGFE